MTTLAAGPDTRAHPRGARVGGARAVLLRRDGVTPRAVRVQVGSGPVTMRAGAGAYARIPAWRSRWSYLAVVLPELLARPRARRVLRAELVDVDTFLRWARTETRYALDQRTGRDVIVRPDTVAREAGMCERHVQRCRRAARRLRVLVDVVPGRRKTLADVAGMHRLAGSHLAGFSTISAFAVPRWLFPLWTLSPLPIGHRERAVRPTVICGDRWPSAAARRGEAVPAPPARAPNRRKRAFRARTAADRAAVTLAAELVERVTWLRGVPPRRIAPALRRFAAAGWIAVDVVDAIDLAQTRNGYSTPTRDRVGRPWALLAWFLRDLDVHADHPRPELIALRESAREWCGRCDPRTRWRGLDNPQRCPDCHPSGRR